MLKEGQERIEKTQQEQGKKLDNLEKTQQEQGKKLDNLDKKVDQRTSDIIDLFRDTWKYFDKQGAEIKAEIHAERFKHLEERVQKLEQQLASDKS